jgi:hypothetical protein
MRTKRGSMLTRSCASTSASRSRRQAQQRGEKGSCTPAVASALGISGELLTRIATQTTHLAEVRAARVILDKLAEVFSETEVCIEDEREASIGLVVDSVRRASRQHPNALVTFEETVRYHGQIGVRAAKVVSDPTAPQNP